MNLLRFINIFYKIKTLFSYLPSVLQEEAVDDMENLYELCLLAKLQKLKGEI